MINKVPLDAIIDCTENIYKKATVAIKEAERLGNLGEDEVESSEGGAKLVSIALEHTFLDEVEYKDNSEQFLKKGDAIIQE